MDVQTWTERWRHHYQTIREELGYDADEDVASALHLNNFHATPGAWRHIGTDLRNRRVTVLGASKELETLDPSTLPNQPIIASDGAVSYLLEHGLLPRVVVTDLDGNHEDLVRAAQEGVSMVVHAHGDNQDAHALVEQFPIWVGTFQPCAEYTPKEANATMHCGLGFTDGDRAALLAWRHGARRIDLIAFDFDAEPSKYSQASPKPIKQEKLRFAKAILEDAIHHGMPAGHWHEH